VVAAHADFMMARRLDLVVACIESQRPVMEVSKATIAHLGGFLKKVKIVLSLKIASFSIFFRKDIVIGS
jgi:hypothetical protein